MTRSQPHSRTASLPPSHPLPPTPLPPAFIWQARAYVDADALFSMEPTEAVERLMVTLRVCGAFKSVYFDYKSRATTEVPANPWRIQVITPSPPTPPSTLTPTPSTVGPQPRPEPEPWPSLTRTLAPFWVVCPPTPRYAL